MPARPNTRAGRRVPHWGGAGKGRVWPAPTQSQQPGKGGMASIGRQPGSRLDQAGVNTRIEHQRPEQPPAEADQGSRRGSTAGRVEVIMPSPGFPGHGSKQAAMPAEAADPGTTNSRAPTKPAADPYPVPRVLRITPRSTSPPAAICTWRISGRGAPLVLWRSRSPALLQASDRRLRSVEAIRGVPPPQQLGQSLRAGGLPLWQKPTPMVPRGGRVRPSRERVNVAAARDRSAC